MTQPPQMYPVEPDILRYQLNKMFPYFSDITYRLRPKPFEEGMDERMRHTFACDERFNWYYGREVPFTPDEQVAVLYHEISHLLRNHFGRRHDRDPITWNEAGDREINDWFPSQMTVPSKGIGSKKYGMNDLGLPDEMLAEWYFDRMDVLDLHAREDATAMDPGVGKCVYPNNGNGCDSKDIMPKISKDGQYTIEERGKIHVPVCGGAAGNGDGEGDAKGDEGVSGLEAEAVRRGVAEKINTAHQQGRGNLPGSLVDWADSYLNPIVPWQKLLRTATRQASTEIQGDTTQTFTKPPRRSPPGIILPKKIARRVVAAMYLDTSGSVSDEEINQSVTEVKAALRTSLADLTVSFVDAEVYSSVKAGAGASNFRRPKQLQRGGTDMRKCFEHAETLNPRPNLIVVMTDGETPWPDEPLRSTRTIVLLTQKPSGHWAVPPWVWKTLLIEGREDA